jgi:hypothetical protein
MVTAGLPPPAVIQLVLSPFNQHKDIAAWAQEHGSVLSCNAWSMLSSGTVGSNTNVFCREWNRLERKQLVRFLNPTFLYSYSQWTARRVGQTCQDCQGQRNDQGMIL